VPISFFAFAFVSSVGRWRRRLRFRGIGRGRGGDRHQLCLDIFESPFLLLVAMALGMSRVVAVRKLSSLEVVVVW